MDVYKPSLSQVERLVEMWLSLAESQRQYQSHLLVSENETRIRNSICNHIATGRLLVAEDDSLCGFVMFAIEVERYEQDTKRGLVENLYVEPEYRSEGVGADLLNAAERELVEQGVDAVVLDVMAQNDAGRRFYRQQGYEPHRLEMEKRVSNESD